MAKKKPFNVADLIKERTQSGLNQTAFWSRFGVTQSGGSRYESGRSIPKPLLILIQLHRSGKISDKDLADAMK